MTKHTGVMILTGTVIAILVSLQWVAWADSSADKRESEIRLPVPSIRGGMPLTEALAKRRTERSFTDQQLSNEQISQLCWAAQGITEPGRGLRTAPSALAQYPIAVLIVDRTGLYEYQPKPHALRRLNDGDMLAKLQATANQPPVTAAPLCLILTMDVARLTPKCGEKAERYCLLEAGHVAQNVLLQATALGLASVPVGGIDEAKITAAMKLPPHQRPVYLLPIGYPKAK